jgi:hypothetical protein
MKERKIIARKKREFACERFLNEDKIWFGFISILDPISKNNAAYLMTQLRQRKYTIKMVRF